MSNADSPINRPWRILVVDDNANDGQDTVDKLNREKFESLGVNAEACADFEEAKDWLRARLYDLVVLDLVKDSATSVFKQGPATVEDADEAGIQVLNVIKATRPIPVVFYTAHPLKLDGQENIVATVVGRGDGPASLVAAISKIISSGVPMLARRIENVQRLFLWNFAAKNSAAIKESGLPNELEMLLVRRLAFELREGMLDGQNPETVRPIEFYIYPEHTGDPRNGCVVRRKSDGVYALVMTPSCDLVHRPHQEAKKNRPRKAVNVLLAKCCELRHEAAFQAWSAEVTNQAKVEAGPRDAEKELHNKKTESLNRVLTGQSPQVDRLFYLPAAHAWPDLLADFQDTFSIPYDTFESEYDRIATLDSPFAEAALARFSRYFGRLGTPDLDMDFILKRLAPVPKTSE